MKLDRVSYRMCTARFEGLVESQVLEMSGCISEVLVLSSEATCETEETIELLTRKICSRTKFLNAILISPRSPRPPGRRDIQHREYDMYTSSSFQFPSSSSSRNPSSQPQQGTAVLWQIWVPVS